MSAQPKNLRTMPAWYDRHNIPEELALEAGVRHITDREARTTFDLSAPKTKKLDGWLFPYLDPNTEKVVWCRVRLDNPSKKSNGKSGGKYHGPKAEKRQRTLYYPPNAAKRLKRKSTTIVLVEAEKSVLALEAYARRIGNADLLPLATGGCTGWRDKQHGVLPDLARCDGRSVTVMVDTNYLTNPKVREARDALVAELRSRHCEVRVANLPQLEGVNGPDDLLGVTNGDELMAGVLATAEGAVTAPYSEHALADRFTTEQRGRLRHVPKLGWRVWTGQHWKKDEKNEMEIDVQTLCEKAAAERGKLHEQNRIRSRRTREAIMREAQPQLSVAVGELDKDTMLLGTPRGTVDLRTGKLREPSREDYITKLTAVTPEKRKPELWLKFLREITLKDKALQDYLQVMAGYCLTGNIDEHALFFLYGTGGNGKSVFVSTLLGILGDYAMVAAMDVFTASTYPGHSTSIASLRGARMVAATETEEGSRWAEAKLKAMTGGEPITARFMRENDFTFMPQFKPVISGNHKPALRGVDAAMRRRMHLIPFNLNLSKKEQDTHLAKILEAEWPAILHWAVEGCLRWSKEGLKQPKAVADATEEYLSEQDAIGNWLEARIDKDPSAKMTTPSELYASYIEWASNKGEHYKLSQNQLSQRLADRGFPSKKSNGGRHVAGLKLKKFRGRPTD